mmetsp:Transcript_19113/g.44704  ORF Transcript_19113/g.44704 Transcript_19113/m.44704 type:complete len:219 (+) Transcript_19113:2959-3615(+)
MRRSISCDSPGKRKELRSIRKASTSPRFWNGKRSIKAFRTCPLKSWRFDRYSPTSRRSKAGVCRKNSAIDSAVGGSATKPNRCKVPIHLDGSLLKLRAARAKRRFCSFFRCKSVSPMEVLALVLAVSLLTSGAVTLNLSETARPGLEGGRPPPARFELPWLSHRSASECRMDNKPLSASLCSELNPPRAPCTPSAGNAFVIRKRTRVANKSVQRTSQS